MVRSPRQPLAGALLACLSTALLLLLTAVRGAPEPDLPAPAAVAALPPAPPPKMVRAQPFAAHGQITSFAVDSAALGARKSVNVYLPPGYDVGDGHYPVLYLLRGHESEWLDNKSSASRKGRNAAIIADDLIMSGAIPPVILVMPPLASDDRALIALSVNLPVPGRAKEAPGVGPGRFSDFLVREVIPAVDRQYRTIPNRGHRGVDGFSLGGFSAVSLALRYPDLFASVGAFEGSFVYPGGRLPSGKVDDYLTNEMAVTFGTPPDLDFLRTVNPIDLVAAMAPEQLSDMAFHIQTAPSGVSDQPRGAALIARLSEKGVTNTFTPAAIPGSQHIWYWADEHLKQALPHHLATFFAHE